jgi:hypothetical protein
MKKSFLPLGVLSRLQPTTLFALYLFFLPLFLLGCWYLGKTIAILNQARQRTLHLREAADLAGQWFRVNQTDQGDFVYELYTGTGKPVQGYNIVRQAGSLYSLAQLYRFKPNPELNQTLTEGFAFFEPLSQPESSRAAAIVYEAEKKTNTSALLLLALIEYLEAHPENADSYQTWTHQLAQFLVSTQKDNGGFSQTPDVNQDESDYNNGETFYALVRIYRLDPRPEYREAIDKAAEYLLTAYPPQSPNLSFYAWGMAGFAYLYQTDPQARYWEYLKTSTDAFIDSRGASWTSQPLDPKLIRGNWGVFLEGVAHTAWVAKTVDRPYFNHLKDVAATALERVLSLQVDGPYGTFTTNYPSVRGGICSDSACQTQRIDIVHHNLSAAILYLKFLN